MRASHSVKNTSSFEHDWNRGIHFDTGSGLGSKLEIDAIAPKGSICNPNFPAAAEARFSQINRVIDLTYKALAPVLPNDIIAGSSATLSFAAYSGLKPTKFTGLRVSSGDVMAFYGPASTHPRTSAPPRHDVGPPDPHPGAAGESRTRCQSEPTGSTARRRCSRSSSTVIRSGHVPA